ncbi:class I SAM-dependent methyltransferase [Streptomyces sp. BBFR2]|uniref:class I SAM-dependent methyltransferase n=1 Tax=Streptomyces sp. BBFR2 TaxID=3372854 RepID=UPI0037DA449A
MVAKNQRVEAQGSESPLTIQYIEGTGWRTGVLVDASPGTEVAPALMPTHGEYPIYDTALYDAMMADAERNWRFREALEKHARDRIVLDIGTGPELFWAREGLRSGARQVFAMEAMESSFRTASQTLAGLADGHRATLLHGESTALEIEPKAEVCVAEILGSLPGAEGAAAVFADAKRRLLTPDAVIVPDLCLTQAAAVNFTDLFAGRAPAFSDAALPQLQRLFEWNGGPFDVRLRVVNPARQAVISDSAPVERLEFNGDLQVEQDADVRLTMTRPGTVDGVLTWLVMRCLPDQEPLDAMRGKTNWASIYLPLFDNGIPVEAGDVMNLTFRTVLSEDGIHPEYDLTGELHTATGVHRARHFSPYRSNAAHRHPVYRSLFPE